MPTKILYPQQDLADRLREALESSNTSQADLARACNVTDQAVHGWLTNGRIAKHHLPMICHATKKPLEYFLVGLKTWRRVAALALPFLFTLPQFGALLDQLRCVLCQIVLSQNRKPGYS